MKTRARALSDQKSYAAAVKVLFAFQAKPEILSLVITPIIQLHIEVAAELRPLLDIDDENDENMDAETW